jgi:hypothetical protein
MHFSRFIAYVLSENEREKGGDKRPNGTKDVGEGEKRKNKSFVDDNNDFLHKGMVARNSLKESERSEREVVREQTSESE